MRTPMRISQNLGDIIHMSEKVFWNLQWYSGESQIVHSIVDISSAQLPHRTFPSFAMMNTSWFAMI